MKRILILFGVIIFGCRSSPEISFDSLNQAFVNWYFKYHPVESTRYNIKIHSDNYASSTKAEMDEYYADISRFLIELSQIDATKISPASRIDYEILYSKLEEMKFIYDEVKPWEWNPLWILDELYDGIYILSERTDINMDSKVNAIKLRLEQIPELLHNSKLLLTTYSKIHILYSNTRLDMLENLLKQLPLKLNSDNITLDSIDELINKANFALDSYKVWLNSYPEKLENFAFPKKLNLNQNGFQYYMRGNYLPAHVYKLATKKLRPTQDRLFHLSLPFYLKENDEPVWLDREDTLEVINWVIEDIDNNPKFKIKNDEVLSQFYESLTNIEKFCHSKSLLPKNKNKTIHLEFAQEYANSQKPVFLFDNHPKQVSTDIIYNIRPPNDDFGEYPLNKLEIDILNALHIIPGYGIQLAFSQNYPSMIRYLFPDLVTSAGWKSYALNMLIEEGYGNWEQEYHILKLKEEISIIVRAIIEIKYYSGDISRDDAIKYLSKMAFIKKDRADILLMESDLHYFSGTTTFIGIMEMSSLLAGYKRTEGNKFKLSEFHRFILKDGVVPLFNLKKKVLEL